MREFEVVEEKRISIHTSTTSEHRSDAVLVIKNDEEKGTKLISPATLEIEADSMTAQLAMTADEMLKIGQLFVKQAKLMKEERQNSTG